MSGTPIVHRIMDALKEQHPRALHISEIAHLTDINQVSVSSSLNNRLENPAYSDIERISRGVWKYVPPATPKPKVAKSLRSADAARVPEVYLKPGYTQAAPTPPRMLKVVGTTSQGLLAVDQATGQTYLATKM